MVFSVAVGYIKHLAMTRVAWELLCFQPLQTRGSDAGWRQPSPRCGAWARCPCVGTACAVCAGVRRETVCQRHCRDRLALLLGVAVTHTQGFTRSSPAHRTCSPSSAAGSGLPGVCGLWPAAAGHCSHRTRARGAAPLGGSSHSRRRLLSRWDLGGCAGGPWGHRGAWQSQASTGTGCWAACCHRIQEMWGALALVTCGSWYSV